MRMISFALLISFYPLVVSGFTTPCTTARSAITRSPKSLLSVSTEEDVELTRKVIIDHIEAMDSSSGAIVDDDDDDDDDNIKEAFTPPKEQEDLEAETAAEYGLALGGLAKGTANTYIIPGMEEMGAEEYRDKLQETISARQAQRRKRALTDNSIGNRSSSGYLDKLNPGGSIDPLNRSGGDTTTDEAASNRPPKWQPGNKEEQPSKMKAEKPKKKKKTPPPQPAAAEIDISRLNILVGVINKAWEHETADKLFCEEIDVGEAEPRQIASGLRAHYSVEDLEGRRVCVLANLKSRKLMGFPSHGMVLCASSDDGSKVVFVDPPEDAAIGERVTVQGYEGEPATENQVIKKKMLDAIFPNLRTDSNGVASYKGVPLTAGTGKCIAEGELGDAQVS